MYAAHSLPGAGGSPPDGAAPGGTGREGEGGIYNQRGLWYISPIMMSPGLGMITVLISVGAAGCHPKSAPSPSDRRPTEGPLTFSLYALSRGKGVPEPTRETYQKVRNMLRKAEVEGTVIRLRETRVGLEGETRIEFELSRGRDATTLMRRIREFVQGVDLLNLVEEPSREP